MQELWKAIPDYESYEVSNLGNVRNSSGKILSQPINRYGYKTVSLCKNARQKTFPIHRLVATSFVANNFQKDSVDHINGVKTDNRATNLQWMSARDNLQKYHKEVGHVLHENIVDRRTGRKRGETRRIPIIQYSKTGTEIKRFCSLMDAERETGIGSGRISLCINGKKKSAGGYLWKKETQKQLVPETGDWR